MAQLTLPYATCKSISNTSKRIANTSKSVANTSTNIANTSTKYIPNHSVSLRTGYAIGGSIRRSRGLHIRRKGTFTVLLRIATEHLKNENFFMGEGELEFTDVGPTHGKLLRMTFHSAVKINGGTANSWAHCSDLI